MPPVNNINDEYSYQKRIIAFIDILGFKKLILKSTNPKKIIESVLSLHYYFKEPVDFSEYMISIKSPGNEDQKLMEMRTEI